jgi:hypothetical protein
MVLLAPQASSLAPISLGRAPPHGGLQRATTWTVMNGDGRYGRLWRGFQVGSDDFPKPSALNPRPSSLTPLIHSPESFSRRLRALFHRDSRLFYRFFHRFSPAPEPSRHNHQRRCGRCQSGLLETTPSRGVWESMWKTQQNREPSCDGRAGAIQSCLQENAKRGDAPLPPGARAVS